MADTYDIIVIGAGPGGYVTAIRAAQLGFKTAVVDREHLGGICLNWGCIPTKALLRSAEVYHQMQHADAYGLSAQGVGFDLDKVVKRSRGVSSQLSNGVGFLLKKNKVDVIWGEAKVTKPGEIVVEPAKGSAMGGAPIPPPKGAKAAGTYAAKHIIIATGARPRTLPGMEADGKLIWTYYEAMVPKSFPKSLLVMGSGAIGVEFAYFYRAMGAEVTIVEVLPQILPVEDAEIAAFARKRFEKLGIKILTGAKVTGVEKGLDTITATIDDGKGGMSKITADRMISAVGVMGNGENLGLEALGVTMERGIIATDGYGRTNVAGIYAIGDVAGPPMLAHKAEHEGVICVETIKGLHTHGPRPRHDPGLYLLPAADRFGRADRSQGQGGRIRAQDRALSVHRQRQGDRARRARRTRQNHLRRQDRTAPRRPYGRGRGYRAHPGVRGCHELRNHGRRADQRGLPASDLVRNHARGGARRLRPRHPYVNRTS